MLIHVILIPFFFTLLFYLLLSALTAGVLFLITLFLKKSSDLRELKP